jgi:tetratricopeptide (TPR) repeat protein
VKITLTILLFLPSLFGFTQNTESLIDRGYAKYLTEDYAGAILDFELALKEAPTNAEIYYLMGACYSVSGNSTKAIGHLSSAIQLEPCYAEAFYERGVIYLTDQNPTLAIKEFDEAIICEPEFAEAYVSRGTAHCMLDEVEMATLDWAVAKKLGVTYTEYMICE